MKNTQEKIHAKHSPSKYPALLACPCFESKPPSVDTHKGTDVHSKLESFLQELKSNGNLDNIDTSTLDCFEWSAYHLAQFVQQVCPDLNSLMIEEKIVLDDDTWGWCDVAWYDADEIIVIDFKTFKNISRTYEAQLAGYVFGLAKTYPLASKASLITWYGDNTHTITRATINEVVELVNSVRKVIMSEYKKPTCCGWCDLCKHNGECPAFKALAVSVTEEKTQELASEVSWKLLSAEKKVSALLIAEKVEKWAKAIKDLAKADLEAGAVIADDSLQVSYVLTNVRGKLVPNTAKACAMLVEQGVPVNTIKERLTISATDIKALLKDKGYKGKALDELIEAVSERGAGSSKMEKK